MKKWIIIDHKLHKYMPKLYDSCYLACRDKEILVNKHKCSKKRFEIITTNN